MITGWYYLHTNGELIYRRDFGDTAADLRESDFVKALWPLDPQNRETAWALLIESLAAGARPERVHELAAKWACDEADAQVYAQRVGARIQPDGGSLCATRADFSDLATSPAGFGATSLEALAELAKALGYRPQKLWGRSFRDLLKV